MAATSDLLRTAREVGGFSVDLVFISIDKGMLVTSGRKVGVGAAHGCARKSGSTTKRRRRVNIAKRVSLVTVVDEVVLTVETGVGTVAVVLVEASGSGGRGGWCWSSDGNSCGAAVETFVKVRLGLVVRDASSRWTGILTTTSLAHLSSCIEILLKLVIA